MSNQKQIQIQQKFDALITEGNNIHKRCGWDGSEYHHFPSSVDYRRFRTEAMNLIRRVCGETSDHYEELRRIAEDEKMNANSYYFKDCLGIVEAAKKDYEGGFLFDLRSLVLADLLGDFIDQAEHLLAQGYHIPAASLAGAVLEDVLRKLCVKHNIPMSDKPKIDKLNADLAKAEIYDKGVQKRITALADIRNNADHGNFEKVLQADVQDMVKYVQRFSTDILSK